MNSSLGSRTDLTKSGSFQSDSRMLQKFIGYFGADGILHILVSYTILDALALVLPLWIAAVATVIMGVGKELIYDMLCKKGNCDPKDLIADGIGIVSKLAVSLIAMI